MSKPIFVFGSNLAGIHGAGAAAYANMYKGARWGEGHGHYGDSYALPTKDEDIKTLPLDKVSEFIGEFLDYARDHPDLTFHLTPIGCGLAGYSKKQIWPILQMYGVPKNVYLTSTWVTE